LDGCNLDCAIVSAEVVCQLRLKERAGIAADVTTLVELEEDEYDSGQNEF